MSELTSERFARIVCDSMTTDELERLLVRAKAADLSPEDESVAFLESMIAARSTPALEGEK